LTNPSGKFAAVVMVNGVTGGLLIVKSTGSEVAVPLSTSVFVTVTWAVPAAATSLAEIVAVSWVELS
jgi:hypothetical protein